MKRTSHFVAHAAAGFGGELGRNWWALRRLVSWDDDMRHGTP